MRCSIVALISSAVAGGEEGAHVEEVSLIVAARSCATKGASLLPRYAQFGAREREREREREVSE